MSSLTSQKPAAIRHFLRAGLIAGFVAAIINIAIYSIMMAANGMATELIVFGSILVASFLPNLLSALLYALLMRNVPRPRVFLTSAVIIFVFISILPHLGIGPAPTSALTALPEGFDVLTVPLHIVFGMTAVTILPALVPDSTCS